MIVITTPTGDIGHQLVADLLRDGSEAIRLIARDPARISAEIRERVELVQGSHGDANVVNAAFDGADSLFWVAPPDFGTQSLDAVYSEFARAAVSAIQRHAVKRVVAVSALGRGTGVEDNAGLVTASLAMDDLLRGTGAGYRSLAMPSFMENILRQVEPIKHQGMFFGPISAELKLPTVATRDIASVAAGLLLDHSWTGQETVPVLGPEDLSFNEMAHTLTEVLGKEVRYQQIPFEALAAQFAEHGASETIVTGMIEMLVAKDHGLDNGADRSTAAQTPTSFRQWATEVLKPAVLG